LNKDLALEKTKLTMADDKLMTANERAGEENLELETKNQDLERVNLELKGKLRSVFEEGRLRKGEFNKLRETLTQETDYLDLDLDLETPFNG